MSRRAPRRALASTTPRSRVVSENSAATKTPVLMVRITNASRPSRKMRRFIDRSPASPPDRQGLALGETRRRLHPDHHSLMQFGGCGRTDIGAGAAYPGGDVVEQILNPATVRVQPHPRRRDAFFEQRFTRPLECAVGRGAGGYRPLGGHPVALFVRLVVVVEHQVARRLVGARE